MMVVQVTLSSLLVWSFMISYAYFILKPPITVDERLTLTLVVTITNTLFYMNYAKSFYIYTLSSQLFRSIYVRRMKLLFHLIFRRFGYQIREENASNTRRLDGENTAQYTLGVKSTQRNWNSTEWLLMLYCTCRDENINKIQCFLNRTPPLQ